MPAAKKKASSKAKTSKKSTSKKASASSPKKKRKTYAPLKGMKDILPKDGQRWLRLRQGAEDITRAYNYGYIATPILESSQLFVRTVGKGTDVVSKEMYVFEDKDGSKVALRPEGTAAISRAYISNGMHTLPQPVKLWYYGPMFRHEKPQAGRYRQFHQFSAEVLGSNLPVVDAELISIAYNYIRDLGIESTVSINSIGTLEDRQNYLVELVGYLRSKRSLLSEESKARINKNPLRILDSKDEGDQEVVQEGPQIIDWLSQGSKDHFMKVLEYLDALNIPYILKPTLVRGLDYYTDTVFEIYADDEEQGQQSALGGGGRYDLLVEQIGGQETPAAGFSIGLERVHTLVKKKEEGNEENQKVNTRVYFAQLGVQARRRALALVEELRRAGIEVSFNLAKGALKAQLETANKLGVTHAIILGQKEVQDNTIIIRDMESGMQEIIDQKKLEKELRRILK